MKKKLLNILLCSVLLIGVTGCGNEKPKANGGGDKTGTKNNNAVPFLKSKANKESLNYSESTDDQKGEMWTFSQEKTEQIDALTEYRYIGSGPKNYVTFNDELWRIIGVFSIDNGNGKKEERVKIIRVRSDGGDKWDESKSLDWSNASLNAYLNESYFNQLNDDAKAMIDNSTWYLGASESRYYDSPKGEYNNVTPNSIESYKKERGSLSNEAAATKVVAKVGLLYPSDYGFSSSGSSVTNRKTCYDLSLYSYGNSDYEDCYKNSWIYASKDSDELTLMTSTGPKEKGVFTIERYGALAVRPTDYSYVFMRPVIYLNSNVKITSGNGTMNNPYKLEA